MAPNINNPGGVKNDPDEIRDGVVSDATRFPGGFIDQQITEAGANILLTGQFQVSTASFTDVFSLSPQTSAARSVTFNTVGSKMYSIDAGGGNILQYNLSTAFDVSSATFDTSLDVFSQDATPTGLSFNADGSRMYMLGRVDVEVNQYDLSTAFDVSSATFQLSFDVSSQDSSPRGVDFNADGSRMYVAGTSNANIYQYDLSTAFDISSATFGLSFDVSSQTTNPHTLTFNDEGSRLYVVGKSSNTVFQYLLSNQFDVSTATFDRAFDASSEVSSSVGIAFSTNGTRLYVVGETDNNVYEYVVGTVAGDVS